MSHPSFEQSPAAADHARRWRLERDPGSRRPPVRLPRLLLRAHGKGLSSFAVWMSLSASGKSAASGGGFHLTISGCLGPCPLANVVLILFRGRSVWLHSINSPDDVDSIYGLGGVHVARGELSRPARRSGGAAL